MEYLKLAVEFVKAAAWPLAIAWVAYYFRDAIIAQLPRVTKVGPVTLDPPPPPQQANLPTSKDPAEAIKKVEAAIPPELLREGEAIVRGLVPKSEDRDLLTLSSGLLIGGLFERTYNFIFGSQLLLLERLNSSPLSLDDLKEFYERGKTAFPEIYKTYTFEQWLAFLESSSLVARVNGGSLFAITPRARGFLRYLIDNGYTTQKVG
ncbi:hypothetical protein ABH975_004183 [Bradyrhizobium ottawaense]|uniref:hypothetical protein n=1 Tax=Bradyrhizobium ottawaense TaxID=931866 RepID=UPI0035119963